MPHQHTDHFSSRTSFLHPVCHTITEDPPELDVHAKCHLNKTIYDSSENDDPNIYTYIYTQHALHALTAYITLKKNENFTELSPLIFLYVYLYKM